MRKESKNFEYTELSEMPKDFEESERFKGLYIKSQTYSIPVDPKKLIHKKMNILEWIVSKIMQSHVCLICGRKEIWSVKSWLSVDEEGNVVCNNCTDLNPEIFYLIKGKENGY